MGDQCALSLCFGTSDLLPDKSPVSGTISKAANISFHKTYVFVEWESNN